jgi:glutathione synthase/RimK-type ligase-like ATP-grasp enzyme
MNIVLLSCDSLDGYVVDDNFLVEELTKNDHKVTTLSWTKNTDWSQFDCAILRTTWDYMERPEEFFKKLELISKETKIYNKLDTIKWNIHKSYLETFSKKGIQIVPTIFFKENETLNIPTEWGNKIVIKPAISAGSYKTLVLNKEDLEKKTYQKEIFPGDWMCQPFLPQIAEGEISLIYFNKEFSHALLKVPKQGEFRVQEEFGGGVIPLTPSEELLQIGEKIMGSVSDELLYARVDLISFKNSYALMELELIEPALYFRTHPQAASNFLKALNNAK